MRKSQVKAKLKANKPVLVPALRYFEPDILELLGLLGFDCVWLCNEHSGVDSSLMKHLIRAGRASNIDCMIRPGACSSADDYTRFFEMGCSGLMIPHVRNRDDAERIVRLTKFPPTGARGMDPIKADADFGLMHLDAYLEAANAETFLVLQIEDVEAIDNIERIAQTPGVDVLYVGMADLSLAMGIPGQLKHPDIQAVIKRTVAACKSAGIACGTSALGADYAQTLLEMGVTFLGAGSDHGILMNGFNEMKRSFGNLGFAFRDSR